MASTFSPNLRLELIGTGEQQGTWGATTNVNLGTLLEEAIGGYTSVTVSNSGDTTLTTNNGSADQSRNMVLNLTGTISAARNVIVPAIEKLYVVKNATTGGFAVTVKVAGQTGVSVPNGSTVFVYVDGTDVRAITGSAAQQNIGTSGANVPLLNGTNTWSSSQTFSASSTNFGSNTGSNSISINGAASNNKILYYQTAGLNRWAVYSNPTAETGSNIGSNFAIGRYDDAGAAIDTPLIINRNSGITTLTQLSLVQDLAVSHGGTGASDAATARTNLELGTAATQDTGTSGANVPLLNGANTWSLSQTFSAGGTFGSGTGNAYLSISGGAGSERYQQFYTGSNARWSVGASNAAESGSNVGSAYVINRFNDAGAYIDTPFSILRSTGVTTLKELSLTTDLAVSHGGTGASDQAGARTNLGLGTAATQNTGTSGANVPLLNGANTWSGAQTFSGVTNTFGSGSTSVNVYMNGAAGQVRGHIYRTAGADRWIVGAGANAETGSNAGTPYFINRYTDAGVYIDTPLSIDRATGVTTLKELNLTTALAVAEGGTGTTTATGTGSVVRAASPALSGTPTAPTAAAYTNTTQIATAAQVYGTVSTAKPSVQTGAAYTLALTDQGATVFTTSASAVTLTVPTNASVAFPAYTRIDIVQVGTGQVTVAGAAGVVIGSSGSKLKLSGQYSAATLLKTNTDDWVLIGDLA